MIGRGGCEATDVPETVGAGPGVWLPLGVGVPLSLGVGLPAGLGLSLGVGLPARVGLVVGGGSGSGVVDGDGIAVTMGLAVASGVVVAVVVGFGEGLMPLAPVFGSRGIQRRLLALATFLFAWGISALKR